MSSTYVPAAKAKPPTWIELRQVGFHNAMPFIGFGFLDNLIMILAVNDLRLSF
jgi:hypothetical protein